MANGTDPTIDFHYIATANGAKVAIMLEELALPYRLIRYEMFAGEHLTPEFRRLNPNCKLPVLVDHAPADGGAPLPVFESGAILLYLAEKTGRFLPADPRGRSLAQQWLIWQMAGLGPMHGQAHHFLRYAPEGQDYAVERYSREARRQLAVMEYRLEQAEYLAGDYGIADMACFAWASASPMIGIPYEDFPAITRWRERVGARPAVVAAGKLVDQADLARYTQERAVLTAEQWSAMFGDRMHAASHAR